MDFQLAKRGIEQIKSRHDESFLINKRFCVNCREVGRRTLAYERPFAFDYDNAFVPRIDLMAGPFVRESLSSGTGWTVLCYRDGRRRGNRTGAVRGDV
jgi:hypothetical protein